MERSKIASLLQARPFEPFTVHVVDGDLLGVRSPEYMWLPPIGQTVFIIVPKDAEKADLGELKILGLEYISHVTVGPIAGLRFPAT